MMVLNCYLNKRNQARFLFLISTCVSTLPFSVPRLACAIPLPAPIADARAKSSHKREGILDPGPVFYQNAATFLCHCRQPTRSDPIWTSITLLNHETQGQDTACVFALKMRKKKQSTGIYHLANRPHVLSVGVFPSLCATFRTKGGDSKEQRQPPGFCFCCV